MKKRRIMIAMLIGTMALSSIMTGCGTNTSNTQSSAEAESGDSADSTQGKISLLDTSDMFTKRDLDASYDESECTAITLDDENRSCDSDAVTIDGQTVTITSEGTIFVAGAANDGNGAFDYNGTAAITGGTVVAAGMSGMAQNFEDDSSQGAMLINLDDTQSGEITLTDADGKELISFTPSREYNSVVISCADLEEGATYTLNTGETATEVTLSSLVYSNGQSQGGQPGGMQNGQMPDQNGQSDSNAPSGQPGDGTDPGQGGPDGNGNGGPGGQPGQGGPGQNNTDNGQSGTDQPGANNSQSNT